MITNKPWCTTFETVVPRGKPFLNEFGIVKHSIPLDFLVQRMAKGNCKAIIAMSDCCLAMQRQVWESFHEYKDNLNAKTIKIDVPQPILADAVKNAPNKTVKFIFIGKDFVRKGGLEILAAMRDLRMKRTDFELYLIGNTHHISNYAFRLWQDEKKDYSDLLAWMETQDWITHFTSLSNEAVLNLIRQCDVGLLPTWSDTYGYSVLEFQAAGLPVISTNVRALPEINTNGWLLDLPTNSCGELGIKSSHHKFILRQSIRKQLYDVFFFILEHPEEIRTRGQKSLEYIRNTHSPDRYVEKIKEVYSTFHE